MRRTKQATGITTHASSAGSSCHRSTDRKPHSDARRIGKVGERVESAGTALTVNGVKRADRLSDLFTPKPGNVYVMVDVTIENVSREKAPYNPLYFKVKDEAGYEYDTTFAAPVNSLKSGELAAGEKVRGVAAFEVPSSSKGLLLSYQPLVILGGYEVITIALEYRLQGIPKSRLGVRVSGDSLGTEID